jgi:hypothetical protein
MSDDELVDLWQKVSTQQHMFSDFERGNFEGWLMRTRDMRHLHLSLNGIGYAILLNAWCCDTPELYFCLWRTSTTTEEVRQVVRMGNEILRFAFDHLKANRVGAFISELQESTIKLAVMMGFKYEGLLRKAFRFFDKSYDVAAYGLLKEEWRGRQRRLTNVSN